LNLAVLKHLHLPWTHSDSNSSTLQL